MAVQIQNRDPALAVAARQPTGGQGGVVQVAVATAVIAPGMVARRAAERVGRGFTGEQQVRARLDAFLETLEAAA